MWNEKTLNNDLKRLRVLYNKEKNPTKKFEFSNYIQLVEEMITNYMNYKKQFELAKMTGGDEVVLETPEYGGGLFQENRYIIPAYKVYIPHVRKFIREVFPYADMLDDIEKTESKNFGFKELLELTESFYGKVGGDYYKKYKEIAMDKRRWINFEDCSAVRSETYFIPGLNKYYMNLGIDDNDDEILEAYIHEVGHIIAGKMNNRRYNSSDYIYEIESLFFEIIADRFLRKECDDPYFTYLEKSKLSENYQKGQIIDIYDIAYNEVIKNITKINNPDKVFEGVAKDEGLISFDNISFAVCARYAISYICAIELAMIFEEDKERALALLQNIITEDKTVSEYEKIVRNITPNEHVKKYLKEIKRTS